MAEQSPFEGRKLVKFCLRSKGSDREFLTTLPNDAVAAGASYD
jgi:hypothetical protein